MGERLTRRCCDSWAMQTLCWMAININRLGKTNGAFIAPQLLGKSMFCVAFIIIYLLIYLFIRLTFKYTDE